MSMTGIKINGKVLSIDGTTNHLQIDGTDVNVTGAQGASGTNGVDGINGTDGVDGTDGTSGASIVSTLPAATLDLFGTMTFVLGDTTYLCVANVEAPTTDDQCFWVEI